jgi:hypothetical protein
LCSASSASPTPNRTTNVLQCVEAITHPQCSFLLLCLRAYYQHKQPELAQVKQHLKQSNPSWHIPDRRLRKFLKHHLSETAAQTTPSSPSPDTLAISDDVSQISTASKRHRFGGLGRKIFSLKSSKSSNKHGSSDGGGGSSSHANSGGGPPLVEIETPASGLTGLPPMEEEDYAQSPIGLDHAIVAAGTLPNEAEISLLDNVSTSGGVEATPTKETMEAAAAAYADENSGGKEKPCFPCAICIIM